MSGPPGPEFPTRRNQDRPPPLGSESGDVLNGGPRARLHVLSKTLLRSIWTWATMELELAFRSLWRRL